MVGLNQPFWDTTHKKPEGHRDVRSAFNALFEFSKILLQYHLVEG